MRLLPQMNPCGKLRTACLVALFLACAATLRAQVLGGYPFPVGLQPLGIDIVYTQAEGEILLCTRRLRTQETIPFPSFP